MEELENQNMKNAAITLLDVLGWKGIWQRRTNAITELKQLIEGIELRAYELTGGEKFKSKKFEAFKLLKPEIISISDTIAIITYGDDIDVVLEFHGVLSALLIARGLQLGIPLRGATSYGKLNTKDNILIGPAVDEVASWYETVNWIGVIQTPSALWSVTRECQITNLFINEKVLLKQHGSVMTNVVNWPHVWTNHKKNEEDLKSVFLRMGPLTPDIAIKLFNSKKFYDENKENQIIF
ncbi:hypothetical protein J2T12_001001 [Paenibacillus anaericanus]|uniref:hypothetical protein n=1 Tax=Paenibacillus anaericanus TaxID=170367 RepID=UPI002788C9F1|nr:hypothetical protein [Paenibacillus anaericanus]MDQ0087607.1 hypothetical protein [Paenibacillus anaericanus]